VLELNYEAARITKRVQRKPQKRRRRRRKRGRKEWREVKIERGNAEFIIVIGTKS